MPFVSPEQVIRSAGVKHGAQAADFGSGAGFYALALARAVGPSGRVYALDVQKEMLELVRSKARAAHFLNIVTMIADLERPRGSKLAENSMDHVVISNILFQTEDRPAILKEAFRILKSGGAVVLVEWSTLGRGSGPRAEKIVPRETAENLLNEAGFRRDREFYAGDNHYGLIYTKP